MINEWISVDDRLPETESDVFVVTRSKSGGTNVDKGYYFNGRWVHRGTAKVIFWMPIPEVPKAE